MKEKISGSIIWNEGSKAALALGAVPVLYTCITTLIAGMGTDNVALTLGSTVMTFILWAAKLVICILLMRRSMRSLVKNYEGVDNAATNKFGLVMAFLSAVIVAAFSLANISIISPDTYKSVIDTAMQSYAPMMDANSLAAMDGILNNLPTIAFFSQLIYCFLFGAILSAILSRNIPPRDPFEGLSEVDESSADDAAEDQIQ